MDRKKPARFTEQHDVKLLREVVAHNPYNDCKAWVEIATSVSDPPSFTIDGKRAQERTNLMVSKFKKDTAESLKKSGVDKDVTEKDVLLEETIELMKEAEIQHTQEKGIKIRAKSDEAAAKDMRKRVMEGMKKDDEGKPKSKRLNALGYLQAKQEHELEMRKHELDVRKQELDLQCRRFELERQERQTALELQKKQSEMLMLMLNINK